MRCGFKLKSGKTCQVPIVHPMKRCRHHTALDLDYVRAKQKADNLLRLQRDETAATRSAFADTAFAHGLADARTIAALDAWRAAKAAEGGPDYPAWFVEEGRRR